MRSAVIKREIFGNAGALPSRKQPSNQPPAAIRHSLPVVRHSPFAVVSAQREPDSPDPESFKLSLTKVM
jgi:hypothetical protein